MTSSADTAGVQRPLQRMGGFPPQFVEMSNALGRYDKVAGAASAIAARFPAAEFPRALDICCGSGHWASALHDRGYAVTGVDASAEQLASARRRCPDATFILGDMAQPPGGPFDLAINTYSSFGYGLTVDEDLEMLRAWHRALRDGGVLVMEGADMERARHVFGNTDLVLRGDGVQTPLEELRMDWARQLLFVQYTMPDWTWGGFTRLYTAAQLADLLARAGFRDIAAAGDFRGRPKRPEDWLVVTCRK